VAMFRPGDPDRSGPIRPGLFIVLGILGAACVATGAFGTAMLDGVVAPAASVLTHGSAWADAVLSGGGNLPSVAIPFAYLSPAELAATAGSVLIGLLVLWKYGTRAQRLQPGLTAIATGSVNDYTAYLTAGAVAVCLALTL
jgi:hypothetical protein